MTDSLTTKQVSRLWVPLAMSWMLMAAEGPLLGAAMARLDNPEINLAAYGGIVWPLALIIEAPIIMLLAASTALSVDWESYKNLRKFMMITSLILTIIHILVAFSPLYYIVADRLIGVPQEILEPGKWGLMVMVPWTWAIACRRFQQGAMIRFGYSNAIVVGTIIRLVTDIVAIVIGLRIGRLPGVIVGAGAQALGVTAEAIYSGIRVHSVVIEKLRIVPAKRAWHWGEFAKFYIPLSMTSLLNLIWQPIGSAAISRMPMAIESLAVWPVVTGLVFILRSPAMAFNEVVVALLGEKGAVKKLRSAAFRVGVMITLVHLLFSLTPLSAFWLTSITGLGPVLVEIGIVGLWLGVPLPALNMVVSWFQGILVHGKKTRGIPEAVAVFLVSVITFLAIGVMWGKVTGLYVGIAAMVFAQVAQVIWLWKKSQPVLYPVASRIES